MFNIPSLDTNSDKDNRDKQLWNQTKTHFDCFWRQEAWAGVWDLELEKSDRVAEAETKKGKSDEDGVQELTKSVSLTWWDVFGLNLPAYHHGEKVHGRF